MADGFDWTALATVLGSQAQAQGDAKTAQNTTALDQFRAELAGRIAEQNAASKRAQDIRLAPTARLAQGATGDFVRNWQPVSVSWGGQGTRPVVSGGVNAMTPDATTQELALAMQNDARERMTRGWESPDIAPLMTLPDAPEMSKSTWMDSLLGGAGANAGIVGEIIKLLGPGKKDKATPKAGASLPDNGGPTTDGGPDVMDRSMLDQGPNWAKYWESYTPGMPPAYPEQTPLSGGSVYFGGQYGGGSPLSPTTVAPGGRKGRPLWK